MKASGGDGQDWTVKKLTFCGRDLKISGVATKEGFDRIVLSSISCR